MVELFSGCGGTSLGFEEAGFGIAVAVDIHKPSIETFKMNHPNSSVILGDIKKISPNLVRELLGGRRVDVLIAGVPCQGFSLNNRKRYKDDKRNFLYKEFIKYIEILDPKTAVLENVSGMISTANGSFVEEIEKEISKAGHMEVASQLLYAPDYGVPQKRRRLVFVGIKGYKFSFDKDMIKTHGPGTKNKYVTIKQAIGDLPSLKTGEEAFEYKQPPFSKYQKEMRKDAPKLTCHKAPNHPENTIKKIKETKPGDPLYNKFKQRIRLSWDDLSPTQVSGGIRPQFQFAHPEDVRGLTIRERCRIQSFPDNFVISGGFVQARVQTGNAVPPLLAEAIALGIKKDNKGVYV